MRQKLITLGVCIFLAIPAFAGFSGSFYPTAYMSGSWGVQQNIFTDPAAVYLSGGPRNNNANGLPLGTYYYQLTDPSGKTLLSTDDISCRQVVVVANAGGNGVIYGVPVGQPPATCTTGYHPDALAALLPLDTNGADPVLLFPFAATPNGGGVYKAWLTPVGSWDSTCTIRSGAPNGVTDSSNACSGSFGFSNGSSKTNNFRIDCTTNTSSSIASSAVGSGGNGYAVGDTGTIAGGTEGSYVVTTVSGGVVTAFTITSAGIDYTVATDATTPAGAQPGSGSGFTISVLSTTAFCTGSTTPQSLLSGTKYFDVNVSNTTNPANPLAGIQEPNDVPLPMWTINIYLGTDTTATPIDTEVTDGGGSWSYFAAQNSQVTVCEVQQTGYTQSGPPTTFSAVYLDLPTDPTPGVNYTPPGAVVTNASGVNCWQLNVGASAVTGLDFGNYVQITGTKHYNTSSADSGPGIPNWPINVTCDAASVTAGYCQITGVVTNASGVYTYLPTGPIASYVVCEGTESTWTQSYPTAPLAMNGANADAIDCTNKTVGWAGTVGTATGAGLDFSNYASISGTKYYTSTTTGLNGWTINLNELTPSAGTSSTVTAGGGEYSFTIPTFPFTANVCETMQTGWTETSPSPATNGGCYSYSLTGLTPVVAPSASTLDFHNSISISGTKHYDTAGNDSGPGIAGFTINIAYTPVGGSATTAQIVTGTGGAYTYTFPGPITGSYTVTETVPMGWMQSYPAGRSWTGTPGTSAGIGLDFGNYVRASGTKYYGSTGTTLNGWTINLNNAVPAVVATTTTAGAGAYSFVIPTYPFTGSICEVLQPGWTEISPSPACYSYVLTSTTVPAGPFNFQNTIVLSGLKFYDLNLDKIQDNGELGISGFKIAIYSCLGTGCTVATTPAYAYTTSGGGFTWTAPAPGITNFKVCEVLPPTNHWTETTTPACYTGTIGQPVQTALTFGNVCEGSGVPYTQGFWHNGNGTAILTSSTNYPGWATYMNAFNGNTNVGYTGDLSFVPTTTTKYGMTKFLGTNASKDDSEISSDLFTTTTGANAANMLSTQLATMELNTTISYTGLISGNPAPTVGSGSLMRAGTSATLTANGCTASLGIPQLVVNSAGYATILSVEQYANSLLLLNPNTSASGPMRSCQTFIQTALNNANNNQSLTIIQGSACSVPTY